MRWCFDFWRAGRVPSLVSGYQPVGRKFEEVLPLLRAAPPGKRGIYRAGWGLKYAWELGEDGELHEKLGGNVGLYGPDLMAEDWMVREGP